MIRFLFDKDKELVWQLINENGTSIHIYISILLIDQLLHSHKTSSPTHAIYIPDDFIYFFSKSSTQTR
ncbi:unnamed protein product [Adineta ricciae]|uniref:Uncharacterized protein n=1 Tax=Adineta ricciae TaxID=249248 RepID=A0A813NJG3_ADIRI|nr:unnamed protein product [Adineta ricciae]